MVVKFVDKKRRRWYNIVNDKILKGDTIMAHQISDECIACGSCEAQCPVNAISLGDGKYEINPDECIDCGACAAQCPVSAISEK